MGNPDHPTFFLIKKMDTTIFIFLNIVMFVTFYYSRLDEDFAALCSGLSGIFALFCLGGVSSGVVYVVGDVVQHSFNGWVTAALLILYPVLSLGFFVLASVYAADYGGLKVFQRE